MSAPEIGMIAISIGTGFLMCCAGVAMIIDFWRNK